jgi:hypothetical protein
MTFCPCPKPLPNLLRKQAIQREEAKARRALYAYVTKREGKTCRLTGKRGPMEHHHILALSLGGRDTRENVVLLLREVHAWVKAGLMRVTGNAETPGGLTFWLDPRVSQSGKEETVTR